MTPGDSSILGVLQGGFVHLLSLLACAGIVSNLKDGCKLMRAMVRCERCTTWGSCQALVVKQNAQNVLVVPLLKSHASSSLKSTGMTAGTPVSPLSLGLFSDSFFRNSVCTAWHTCPLPMSFMQPLCASCEAGSILHFWTKCKVQL